MRSAKKYNGDIWHQMNNTANELLYLITIMFQNVYHSSISCLDSCSDNSINRFSLQWKSNESHSVDCRKKIVYNIFEKKKKNYQEIRKLLNFASRISLVWLFSIEMSIYHTDSVPMHSMYKYIIIQHYNAVKQYYLLKVLARG